MTTSIVGFLTARYDEAEAAELRRVKARQSADWGAQHTYAGVEHRSGMRPLWPGNAAAEAREMTTEEAQAYHAAMFEPAGDAYVLADVASKRRILARAVGQSYTGPVVGAAGPDGRRRTVVVEHVTEPELGWLLRMLAEPFAGHPDYRPEWRA